MNKKQILLYIFLCYTFASTLTAGKIALTNGVTPFALAGTRFLFGALLLFLFYLISSLVKKKKNNYKISYENLKRVIILSVFMFIIPFSCIINGLVFLPSGIAGIIGATIPLFTMIFSHFMFEDEKFTLLKFTGLALGAAGLVVLAFSKGKSFSVNQTHIFVKGFILYITGCASIGLGNALAKKIKPGIAFHVSTFYQALTAGLFFITIAFIFENPAKIKLTYKTYLPVLYVSVFGMALAYVIYYKMLSTLGPVKMSTIPLLIPVLAVAAGYFILDENINLYTISSGILVISGVGLILFSKNRVMLKEPAA